MVEAAVVELSCVLRTRKLLILGTATTAQKAPLPDPLYVYCTKMLFALESNRHHMAAAVSHRFSEMDRKSTSFPRYRKSFLRYAGLPSQLLVRVAHQPVTTEDESQSCRCGLWWRIEKFGVEPDAIAIH
jgi:hypothetical protein